MRSPHTEHAASGLPNTTPLEGGGGGATIYTGSRPAGVTARGLRIITHSFDVNENVLPFHGMCMYVYNCIYSQSISYIYLVYLVFQIA